MWNVLPRPEGKSEAPVQARSETIYRTRRDFQPLLWWSSTRPGRRRSVRPVLSTTSTTTSATKLWVRWLNTSSSQLPVSHKSFVTWSLWSEVNLKTSDLSNVSPSIFLNPCRLSYFDLYRVLNYQSNLSYSVQKVYDNSDSEWPKLEERQEGRGQHYWEWHLQVTFSKPIFSQLSQLTSKCDLQVYQGKSQGTLRWWQEEQEVPQRSRHCDVL